jgi:phosphoribosyl 1,2-cyclic phosphate phosphodiesterase
MNGDWERYHIVPHLTLPGVPFQYKQYKVMPILAQHAAYPELPLNYIIQDAEGKTALIGNDTGWWCDASWEHLKAYKLDIAIIEATMGPKYKDHNRGHLGTGAAVTVRDELKRLGVIDDNTLVAVNHFSHNGLGLHKDMEAFFNPQGIQVCYDGYVLKK